jgi:S1-C subfamily serine protease
VGRHPEANLQFDPAGDLEVSTRHALLSLKNGRWYVRDLDSKNGTLVNGDLARGFTPVAAGDVIQFGRGGPRVALDLESDDGLPPGAAPTAEGTRHRGFTQLIKAEVASRTRRHRNLSAVLVLLLMIVSVTALYTNRVQRERWRAEMASMRAQIDTALQVSAQSARMEESLQDRAEGLQAALEESRAQLRSLRTRLAAAEAQEAQPDVEALRRELLAAQTALTRQQLASNLDFQAIEELGRPVVARVFVEYGSAGRFAATAFSVESTGRLVTNKHVVERREGQAPQRIGVQYAGSRQVFPARVVAVSERSDLAVLQAEQLAGPVPAFSALNPRPDTVASGSPVAVMGFPLAGAVGGEVTSTAPPNAVLSAGLLVAVDDLFLEVEALGAEGSSGSPIFGQDLQVIGILFGGRTVGGDRRLVGVSSTEVLALLRTVR